MDGGNVISSTYKHSEILLNLTSETVIVDQGVPNEKTTY